MTADKSKIALGAWAWGDKDGYFGNTMTADDFNDLMAYAISIQPLSED